MKSWNLDTSSLLLIQQHRYIRRHHLMLLLATLLIPRASMRRWRLSRPAGSEKTNLIWVTLLNVVMFFNRVRVANNAGFYIVNSGNVTVNFVMSVIHVAARSVVVSALMLSHVPSKRTIRTTIKGTLPRVQRIIDGLWSITSMKEPTWNDFATRWDKVTQQWYVMILVPMKAQTLGIPPIPSISYLHYWQCQQQFPAGEGFCGRPTGLCYVWYWTSVFRIHRKLVPKSSYTGKYIICWMFSGRVMQFPMCQMFICTPYHSSYRDMCMLKKPLDECNHGATKRCQALNTRRDSGLVP